MTITHSAGTRIREEISGAVFHPSTNPEEIARTQRREVREYQKANPGATVEEIGAALCLPVFSVQMRLAECSGKKVVTASRKRKGNYKNPFFAGVR